MGGALGGLLGCGSSVRRGCPSSGPGPHRHWQVSSRHHQTCTLDYGYLLGLLEDMQAHWEEAASLPQEQVGFTVWSENVPGGCAVGLLGLGQAVKGRVLYLLGSCPVRAVGGWKQTNCMM